MNVIRQTKEDLSVYKVKLEVIDALGNKLTPWIKFKSNGKISDVARRVEVIKEEFQAVGLVDAQVLFLISPREKLPRSQ